MLRLRNPHSILAALETRPKEVTEIVSPPSLERGGEASGQDAWAQVLKLARENGIRVSSGSSVSSRSERFQRDNSANGGRVSVAEAVVREREPVSLSELFGGAADRAGGKGLWLALDTVQDPHNVGAIFRAASFFGVQGILMTADRSAPLSGAVYDVASGGLEHIPFAVETNLKRALEEAKEAGVWILGTSERAKGELSQVKADRPWLLVLGNEERGMRRLTEEACDQICRVEAFGAVQSLNVSVAAGVLISTLTRQARFG
jgi:23S rRNA (guanosine2251-2'-O)-methyltransferase